VLRNGLLHNIVTLAFAFSTSPDRSGVPREVQLRGKDIQLELPEREVGVEIGMTIVCPSSGSSRARNWGLDCAAPATGVTATRWESGRIDLFIVCRLRHPQRYLAFLIGRCGEVNLLTGDELVTYAFSRRRSSRSSILYRLKVFQSIHSRESVSLFPFHNKRLRDKTTHHGIYMVRI
jgi:hypothetical protein